MNSTANDRTANAASELAALQLWRVGAVRVDFEKQFTLASGRLSPIYINCRVSISDPVLMHLFTSLAHLRCMEDGVRLDVIAGGETAGIPFAAYLAHAISLPMVYVRKQAKTHGIASLIEGQTVEGRHVLLVEDLITDGGSKLHFINALRAAGATVTDALVLLDREQGGESSLRNSGVNLHAVTTLSKLLDVGVAVGHLSSSDRSGLAAYLSTSA